MNISPSIEQQNIISSIQNNKNVVVDSVAGAGKTTTLIFVAEHNPNKKILQITYNKQLKLEVREKMKLLEIENVEIHTYHSLAVKYYDPKCYTDDNIIKVMTKKIPINKPQLRFDLIVIDEVQDMTPNYYELIYKFMKDINFNSNILILGDTYQGVYEFKNADTRFLSFSTKIWNLQGFEQLNLNESYRVTEQIAWFVNKAMLGYDRIISKKKSNHKIYYYKKSIHNVHNDLYKQIIDLFKKGYKPDDIFVLSPALRNANNPVKKLENLLVKSNYPVYFSRNEEEGIDEKLIAGKIVFTSFHQSKGRERKIVIVYGFDDTYFDFYAKNKNRMTCPSELYVAVTRSSDILIVLEHFQNDSLSFLKMSKDELKNSPYIEYIEQEVKRSRKKKDKEKDMVGPSHNTTVTDLTMYLSEATLKEITPIIKMIYTTILPPNNIIDIPLTVKMKSGLVEDVSDLNGLVIPAMYEAKKNNNMSTIQKTVEKYCREMNKENRYYIDKKRRDIGKYQNNPISIYLILGNLYIALTENILSKLNQIDSYNWLSKETINACHKNIKKNIGKNAKYEKIIYNDNHKQHFIYKHKQYGEIYIGGRIDIYDDETLWEVKCTSNLTVEHMLQLLFYSWMWDQHMKNEIGNKKFKLLNIKSGEVMELNFNKYLIDEIVEIIFINKYEQKNKDDDLIFLEKCKKIRRKYI